MLRKVAFYAVAAVCLALPGTHIALADAEGGAPAPPAPAPAPVPPEEPASVLDVGMLVDAQVNGKDVWSPGGRELHWSGAKCPYKISFKGTVQVDKPTKVTYRWERSDGTQSAVLTFDVKKGGTVVEITPPDAWAVGNPGQLFRGAQTFHMMTPTDLTTSTPLRVECQ